MPSASSLLFSILFSLAATSAATTYYISPHGSDQAAGTSPATAWLTTRPANQLSLRANDAILFQGGADHYAGGLVVRTGGTASARVVVGAYGAGLARLWVDGSRENGVTIGNTGAVEVCNLSVHHNSSAPPTFSGIAAVATSTATAAAPPRFEGIYIHDVAVDGFRIGVALGAAGCQGFAGVRLTRVTATGSWNTGILSYGAYVPQCYSHADVIVEDCTAHDNQGDSKDTGGWSGSGIVLSGVDGAVITRSLAFNNGGKNGHLGGGPFGIWAYDANNITISHCVAHHNFNGFPAGNSNDGGGFDIDGGTTNSVIEYCLSFNNAGPGFLVCQFDSNIHPTRNNTVRYSVSLNDGLACSNGAAGLNFFTPDASMSATTIRGVTLVTNNSWPIVAPLNAYSHAFTDTLISQSALLSLGGGGTVLDFEIPAGLVLSGNAYWSAPAPLRFAYNGKAYGSLAAFRAGTGQEQGPHGATGTDADPRLDPAAAFFADCVPWFEGAPSIPNSPMLDELRGFAGCH